MSRKDPNTLMFLVDDFTDDDPKTNDYNPGTVGENPLVFLGTQQAPRQNAKPPVYLYRIGHTRVIVYKKQKTSPVCFKMGLSLSQLLKGESWKDAHAVPMETYAELILDKKDEVVIGKVPNKRVVSSDAWLKENGFKLV